MIPIIPCLLGHSGYHFLEKRSCIFFLNRINFKQTTKNLELARQLAQKEYDEKLQKYIAKRLKQMGRILKDGTEEEIDAVYEALYDARKQLVTAIH